MVNAELTTPGDCSPIFWVILLLEKALACSVNILLALPVTHTLGLCLLRFVLILNEVVTCSSGTNHLLILSEKNSTQERWLQHKEAYRSKYLPCCLLWV